MKKNITLALAVQLIVSLSLQSFAQELTIATFNAEFLNTSKVHIKFGLPFSLIDESQEVQDFWNNAKNRSSKYKEAAGSVAQMIKKINADIITLTEVGDSQDLKVLNSELSQIGIDYDYVEVCDCTDNSTKQQVAVLSKYPLKEVWTQIEGRALYLEEADGDEEGDTGISKGMKVTAIVGDIELDIFVLHLISERSGYESDAKRIAQASIARRAIIKQMSDNRRIIVTGDFNSEKGSQTLYRLRGFDDINEELIQTGNSQYFSNTDVRWTYSYKGEPEQIDHILLSSNVASNSNIDTSIIETADLEVSDHNPVIVKLKLR